MDNAAKTIGRLRAHARTTGPEAEIAKELLKHLEAKHPEADGPRPELSPEALHAARTAMLLGQLSPLRRSLGPGSKADQKV